MILWVCFSGKAGGRGEELTGVVSTLHAVLLFIIVQYRRGCWFFKTYWCYDSQLYCVQASDMHIHLFVHLHKFVQYLYFSALQNGCWKLEEKYKTATDYYKLLRNADYIGDNR